MQTTQVKMPKFAIKEPRNLSPRIQRLRDYYFQGVSRAWNNEFMAWSTGSPWDFQFEELTFYIVPETYAFHQTFKSCFKQVARKVVLPDGFWSWSIPERKAWFIREVMVNKVPKARWAGSNWAARVFSAPNLPAHWAWMCP